MSFFPCAIPIGEWQHRRNSKNERNLIMPYSLYNNTSLACKSNMNGRNYGRKYKIAFYLTYSFSIDIYVNDYK